MLKETVLTDTNRMPTLSGEFKRAVEEIPTRALQKLVMQAAAMSPEMYDIINLQYIGGKDAEKAFFQNTKEKMLGEIYSVGRKRVLQKELAGALAKAVKHLNHYVRVTKDKAGEAELLLAVLLEIFDDHVNQLGTCWTAFDSKLAITTNRLYNLVTKKLHEDYLVQYEVPLNRFLEILHARSNHLDYVYGMPNAIKR